MYRLVEFITCCEYAISFCKSSVYCSVSVNVEACLWLPVLLESALWRQLQRHDPGSAPGPRQNEKPCHQKLEAADWCPHHSELSRCLSSLCKPTFLNLMQTHSGGDINLHALGQNRDREVFVTQFFCFHIVLLALISHKTTLLKFNQVLALYLYIYWSSHLASVKYISHDVWAVKVTRSWKQKKMQCSLLLFSICLCTCDEALKWKFILVGHFQSNVKRSVVQLSQVSIISIVLLAFFFILYSFAFQQ